MDLSDQSEFAIACFCPNLHEERLVAFDYEAPAFREVKNFAEPPQTFFVTPAVRQSEESESYINLDICRRESKSVGNSLSNQTRRIAVMLLFEIEFNFDRLVGFYRRYETEIREARRWGRTSMVDK